jgi:Zn-finger nucleic acid-binding protein
VELSSGELRHCPRCKGSWIPTEVLHEHVSTMQTRIDPKLVWKRSSQRVGLPCAACHHTMETLLLFEVPVDRCHSHGVWFDADELAEVLRRASTHVDVDLDASAARGSTAGAVAAASLDVTAGVTEVALEAASVGLVEGVLEVIGGIFSAIDL